MKITAKLLSGHGACRDDLVRFRDLYPDGVAVTEARCVTQATAWNWNWAARHLLPEPAWPEYKRVEAAAWAEYKRVEAAAWAEYHQANGPAWNEYHQANGPALLAYRRAQAAAFGRLAEREDGPGAANLGTHYQEKRNESP